MLGVFLEVSCNLAMANDLKLFNLREHEVSCVHPLFSNKLTILFLLIIICKDPYQCYLMGGSAGIFKGI